MGTLEVFSLGVCNGLPSVRANAPVDPEELGETTLCPRAGLEHRLSGRGIAFDLHLAGELEDTHIPIALSPCVLSIPRLLFSSPWVTQLFSLLTSDGEG